MAPVGVAAVVKKKSQWVLHFFGGRTLLRVH